MRVVMARTPHVLLLVALVFASTALAVFDLYLALALFSPGG